MDAARLKEKLDKMVRFARDLSELSTCKRLRCGAVVFAKDFSAVYSIGYNGPPMGQNNQSCRDREGDCGCVHAEANAVAKLRDPDGIMYCTTQPCERCAGLIVNCKKVAGVIWTARYRNDEGSRILATGDVLEFDDYALDLGNSVVTGRYEILRRHER